MPFANMVHVAAQITVKALKKGEIVNQAIIYGLSIQYEEKKANYFKMMVDFVNVTTNIDNYGSFPLVDVRNDVISRLTKCN